MAHGLVFGRWLRLSHALPSLTLLRGEAFCTYMAFGLVHEDAWNLRLNSPQIDLQNRDAILNLESRRWVHRPPRKKRNYNWYDDTGSYAAVGDVPLMTSFMFYKKIMNWSKRTIFKLEKIRNEGGAHLMGDDKCKVIIDTYMESVAGFSKVYGGVLDGMTLSTLCHRIGLLGRWSPNPAIVIHLHGDFLSFLLTKVHELMHEMSDAQLATVMYFYYIFANNVDNITLDGITHDELIEKVLQAVDAKLPELQPLAATLVLQGMASMEIDDMDFAKALVGSLEGKSADASSELVASLVYALAELNMDMGEVGGVVDEYMNRMNDVVKYISVEDSAKFVLGVSKLNHKAGMSFIPLVCDEFKERSSEAFPVDITRLAKGLALAQYDDPVFMEGLVRLAHRHAHVFPPQETIQLKKAFKVLEYRTEFGYFDDFGHPPG